MATKGRESTQIGRRTLLGAGVAAGVTLIRPSAAGAAGIDTKAALTSALNSYLKGRVGTLGLCLVDPRNNSTFLYNGYWRTETLSTIKVLVLVALLRRNQETGKVLTTSQKSLATRMICSSDNAATDSLIAQVGVTTMRRVAREVGMATSTIQGGGYGTGWWGYSMSTPLEMVRLLNVVTYNTVYLNRANRLYIQGLMQNIVARQRWGVSDPPLPTSLYTLNKNGWGPRTGGYRVNSMGYVYGSGRRYSLAILSRSPNGFSYGQATVNAVSKLIYNALDLPLR